MADKTLIIIKPDGVQRHLIGEIIGRFEKKGLKLAAAKFLKPDKDLAIRLYAVHKGKPFYDGLVKFLCSSPVLVMVWEAQGVIEITRKMLGATFGYEAVSGTIRGDLGCSRGFNLVHGSDSAQSAAYEIPLFFKPEELVEYEFADEHWLYGKKE
ncbi:MAG: nucleoside-diphosphate kinase [Sedimentisphaerales bacterium]|jgi:nucleoside-diphosphate kinase